MKLAFLTLEKGESCWLYRRVDPTHAGAGGVGQKRTGYRWDRFTAGKKSFKMRGIEGSIDGPGLNLYTL